jgi:hypothetical protein
MQKTQYRSCESSLCRKTSVNECWREVVDDKGKAGQVLKEVDLLDGYGVLTEFGQWCGGW